jgi:ABC-type transport system involved in multi-copper enzyme maturation permease subunit
VRAVVAIARNTIREALRDRVLFLFLGFAVVLLVSTKLFGMLTVGDEGKIIKDFGLAGIQFFSMLISVMMSVLLISREIENRTVFNILSKPVSRWQFLLGKYLGLVTTVALNLALMVLLLVVLVALYQHELDLSLLFAGMMTLLEMALLTAFATLFAVLTKPMLGSVLTLAVFVVGHLAEDVWLLTQHIQTGFSRPVIAAVYYVLPNLERFNFKNEVVHGLDIPGAAVGWAIVYGLTYTVMVLVLAGIRFGRRDLV